MSKNLVEETLSLLGMNATDRVTGFSGMVATVGFDAYGCVQALLNPPMKDGKLGEQCWFDVKRLQIHERHMPAPSFVMKFGEERGGDALPAMKATPVP